MIKDKYLANLDKILIDSFKKESSNLANKDVIPFTEEFEKEGRFQKIAFDVYRVENDPYNHLWLLQDIDGKSHLVRASDPQFNSDELGNWSAISDYDRSNITLAYKKVPIARFSANDYGFNGEDVLTFKSALLERIGTDDTFVKEVLAEQPSTKRQALANTFPELQKFIKG